MKKYLTLIFFLSVSLFGASFDCTKASTKVEKMICADPELSKLDENLSNIFKEAVQIESYKEEIIKDQRVWQKVVRDKWCITGRSDIYGEKKINPLHQCLRNAYRDRINILSLINKKYTLSQSHNENICTPILDILNNDLGIYGRFVPEKHSEFNWLKWENKYKLYNSNLNPKDNERIGELKFYQSAEFDINNDGNNEIVWYFFNYGKYGDEYENIDYSPLISLNDINGSTTSTIFNSSTIQIDYQNVADNFGQLSLYVKPFRFDSSYLLALFGYSKNINFGHHSSLYLTDMIKVVRFNKDNVLNDVCFFKKNLQNNKDK
ncbi:hypothetical protein [Sulfuricurvum sp.]|uniref:lysozyme inhibitor LprI family protein n=1 Tax=Sulfuricurvum sp. TaxID=2025608 RepID=UPI0025D12369|nr:hypothetical protein [Sulfuricurvum sp.]